MDLKRSGRQRSASRRQVARLEPAAVHRIEALMRRCSSRLRTVDGFSLFPTRCWRRTGPTVPPARRTKRRPRSSATAETAPMTGPTAPEPSGASTADRPTRIGPGQPVPGRSSAPCTWPRGFLRELSFKRCQKGIRIVVETSLIGRPRMDRKRKNLLAPAFSYFENLANHSIEAQPLAVSSAWCSARGHKTEEPLRWRSGRSAMVFLLTPALPGEVRPKGGREPMTR